MHASGAPVFHIPIASAALSTAGAWDLCGVTAQSSGRLELLGIDLVIASTQFANGSGIALQFLRGSTGLSTGAAILPRNVKGWSGASTAFFGATGPSSTPVSTASAVSVYAGSFDFRGRFQYRPMSREERLILTLSQPLHIRTTTPQIAVSINGTIVVQDVGKVPA